MNHLNILDLAVRSCKVRVTSEKGAVIRMSLEQLEINLRMRISK